jgi:hypothetical protein
LDEFYDCTFFSLEAYLAKNPNDKVAMFSDSLLFYGLNSIAALEELHRVYVKLLHRRGLLLRGAMVKGILEYEPRFALDNFEGRLPKDDTLARAVGLESTKKGARLLIENTLARELLNQVPEWLTEDGYVRHVTQRPNDNIPYVDMRRRISPTPEQDGYECLYFWTASEVFSHSEPDYELRCRQLLEVKKMLGENIGLHYSETAFLLERCRTRQALTDEQMQIH